MRYGQIRKYDVANGPGVRTTIFVTGCTLNCENCFNVEYQDFNYGNIWGEKETQQVIEYLKDKNVRGLTILGGEPMLQVPELTEIIKEIKGQMRKSQDIWIYSGFTFEQIVKDGEKKELLELCDTLVDGLFINDLKDLTLKFRGSSNQRIINIKEKLNGK